ncbi:unnamed protein product [Ilex paraguariensis]|uniref:Uncharacterized protein n=1 Tax=Ilex paraguariensis TaxID=185542 RepID=A0ABC8RBZ9_9AQUA
MDQVCIMIHHGVTDGEAYGASGIAIDQLRMMIDHAVSDGEGYGGSGIAIDQLCILINYGVSDGEGYGGSGMSIDQLCIMINEGVTAGENSERTTFGAVVMSGREAKKRKKVVSERSFGNVKLFVDKDAKKRYDSFIVKHPLLIKRGVYLVS